LVGKRVKVAFVGIIVGDTVGRLVGSVLVLVILQPHTVMAF